MYVDITDRELKQVKDFTLDKEYYAKNGNGNWYKGKLNSLDRKHNVNTADGLQVVWGMSIGNYVGIHAENKVFELNEDKRLQLPLIPLEIIFGEEKIKIEDLTETEIKSIGRRWTEYLIKERQKTILIEIMKSDEESGLYKTP
jgi:hypothetical protein